MINSRGIEILTQGIYLHLKLDNVGSMSLIQHIDAPEFKSSLTITSESVQVWVKEMIEIASRMEADQRRFDLLSRRIEAVKVLLDADPTASLPMESLSVSVTTPVRTPIKELPPVEIVLYFLKEFFPNGTTTSHLRTHIERSGYPIQVFKKNFRYFYTILSRLEKSEKIIRDGEKIMLKK